MTNRMSYRWEGVPQPKDSWREQQDMKPSILTFEFKDATSSCSREYLKMLKQGELRVFGWRTFRFFTALSHFEKKGAFTKPGTYRLIVHGLGKYELYMFETPPAQQPLQSRSPEMHKKVESVKKHLSDNKTAYIIGTIGLTTGTVLGIGVSGKAVTIVDSFKITLVNWKSPHISQTVVTEIRGHRGNMVKCLETGDIYPSQNVAASVLGLNSANLSQHLNGKRAQAGGLHFASLGENLASR